MKRKFIATRHNWLYGRNAESALRVNKEMIERVKRTNDLNKEYGDKTYPIPKLGAMCIMGQVACQVGVPKKLLDGVGTLEEVQLDGYGLDQSVIDAVDQLLYISDEAYQINDASTPARSEIERELIDLFRAYGFDLQFIQ